MFVLDATRICGRSGPADPAAWVMAAPEPTRREPAADPQVGYSWWSLVRNPHAMLVTGMVGAVVVRDAAARILGMPTGAKWAG